MEKIKKIIVSLFWAFYIFIIFGYLYNITYVNLKEYAQKTFSIDFAIFIPIIALLISVFPVLYIYNNYWKKTEKSFWKNKITIIFFWILTILLMVPAVATLFVLGGHQ